MKPPARGIEIAWPFRVVESEQLQSQPVGVFRLNARFRSRSKELFESLVAEALNHGIKRISSLYGRQDYVSVLGRLTFRFASHLLFALCALVSRFS